MEFPMFRNQRMRPMDVPARQPRAAPPKVVSIPVHFVSSDSVRSTAAAPVQFVSSDSVRSTAALSIQKAMRGLLVRKSIKKIAAIKKEADEIEKKFGERERVELIRKDGKERLKINEMLMGLLFRLDSITGVDFGVRVFRKSVTKKVVMLQERLDEIVSAIEEDESKKSDKIVSPVVEETMDDMVDVALELENKDNSIDFESVENSVVESELIVEEEEGTVEMEDTKEPVVASATAVEDKKVDDAAAVEDKKVDDEKKMLIEEMIEKNEMLIKKSDKIDDMVDVALELENKAGVEDNSMDFEYVENSVVDSESNSESQDIHRDENSKNLEEEEGTVEMEATKEPVAAAVEDEKVDDEKEVLMEKMIEKNEMLIKMVAGLCERNKMQTEMLNSLSKRVDSLEKKQRSKSKKRRQACPKLFYDDA